MLDVSLLFEKVKTLDNLAIQITKFVKVIQLTDFLAKLKESLRMVNIYWTDIISVDGKSLRMPPNVKNLIVSSQTAIFFDTIAKMSNNELDFGLIGGIKGYIILIKLSENRILCIGIKESIDKAVFDHIERIKEIVKLYF